MDKDGNDVYIPGLDESGFCTCDPTALEWVKNVDVPIYLFSGKLLKNLYCLFACDPFNF